MAIISRIKNKIKAVKSLRAQSLIVLIMVGMIPLVLFTIILLNSYHSRAVEQQIGRIRSRGSVICNLVSSSAFFTNDVTSEVDSELTHVSDIFDGRIMVVNKGMKILRDTYGIEEGKTLIIDELAGIIDASTNDVVEQSNDQVLIILPVYQADMATVGGAVVMNFSLADVNRMYDIVYTISLTMLLLFGVIILVTAMLYSAQVVRPLKETTDSIQKITQGDFDETMTLAGYNELDKLSDNFNHMLNDLQNLEESRQEFVSNVSHELKTPITSMKVLAESLSGDESAPIELYREFMGDINDELERMNSIINDLLSLVKLDRAAGQVNISEVGINEFVENILKQLHPIAEKRNIDIVFESVRPVSAQIDEVKLGMAFRNLVENAIKYNFDNGWVRVSLNADHKFFYLKVTDSGEGMSEDALDHIFERFYRVDKARARETGGSGLGLAITRNAINLHRGTIKVHSAEGQGTTFNVRIPLVYAESEV